MNAPTDPHHRDPRSPWGPPSSDPWPDSPPSAAPAAPAPPPPVSAPPPPPVGPRRPPARPTSTLPPPPPWAASSGQNPPPTWPHAPFEREEPTPRSTIGLQNLLLILGTSLVAVAALVFMAVNWTSLGARFQGAILLGLTAVVGTVAAGCARKKLPATAEALGVVTVLLALVDAQALKVGLHPNVAGESWWAAALLVVSAVAWTFSERSGIESPRIAASVLVQAPLLLMVSLAESTWTQLALVMLGQVAAVSLIAHRATGAYRRSGLAALTVAGTTAVVAVLGALLELAWSGSNHRGPALVLLVAGAVAALTSWRWADRGRVRVAALAAAPVLGLLAAIVALPTYFSPDMAVAATALIGAVVAGVGFRVNRRWGGLPATIGASASLLWSTPLLVAFGATAGDLGAAMNQPWTHDLGDRAGDLQRSASLLASPAVLAVHLGAFLLLALATSPLIGRRRAAWGVVGTVVLAALIAPALGAVSLAVAAALPLALAVVLVAVSTAAARWSTTDRRLALSGSGGLVLVGLGWSLAVTSLTVGTLALVTALAAIVTIAGRARLDLAVASVGAGVTVTAGSVLAAVGFAADGLSQGASWAAASVAACALGLVGVLLLDLDRRDPEDAIRHLDRAVTVVAEVAAWVVHGIAFLTVVGLDDRSAISVVLAAGTIAAGLQAARPHRQPFALAALVQGLLLVWLRLLEAGVRAPEPYVLPVAAVLATVGLLAERRADRSEERLPSWSTIGPALVVGFAPSTWLAFTEGGITRPLVTLAMGGLVLALGALTGRRAAVDVGVAVVVALGLRQIAPVVGSLPGWVTIGCTGAVLLAVGATFEQRRRDVHDVRRRYRTLL